MVDGGALAVLLADDAREVADEAVEVGEVGLEVDLDVRVVDEALLELLDQRRRVVALDRVAVLHFLRVAFALGVRDGAYEAPL